MPELVSTSQLPAVVQPRRTVLDVLERFRGAPPRQEPRELLSSAVLRRGVDTVGHGLRCLGAVGATMGVLAAFGFPPVPEVASEYWTMGGMACTLAGIAATLASPLRRTDAAQLATKHTLTVANSLPLPPADAPKVERAVVALLALWLTGRSRRLDTSEAGKNYRAAANALLATVDPQEVSAIENVLEKLYDPQGRPLSRIHEIDCLAASIRALEPDLRVELMAFLEPHITGIRPLEASWRNDALSAAIEGKDYAYGALASKELAELAPNTPERVRMDALDSEIGKQLKEQAHRDELLFAQVVVPDSVAIDHAFRLAGKYEELGYRAYMHREQRGVRLSITSPDGMLSSYEVEGYHQEPAYPAYGHDRRVEYVEY